MSAVERTLTLGADAGRVWEAVTCGAWLGDDGLIDPRPGADGWVREGDVVRHLVVEASDEPRRLVFRWWALGPDGVGPASRVAIDLEAAQAADDAEEDQTRVVVVETPLPAGDVFESPGPQAPQALAMAAY